MAAASDVLPTPPPARRWLYGPAPDLLLGCGALHLSILFVYAFMGSQIRALHPSYLLVLMALVISSPHYGATLLRVYENRKDRRSYVIFSLYATLAVYGAFAYGVYNVYFASLMFTLYLTWSPWHYAGQNYGIAVMFLHRRGVAVDATTKRLLHWSFRCSFVLVFLVFHTSSMAINYGAAELTGSMTVFVPLGIPLSVGGPIFGAVLLAYLACLATAAVRLLGRASPADLGPSALLVLIQALWFSIPFALRFSGIETGIESLDQLSIRFYVVLTAVAHATQYLWITTYYAEASPRYSGRFNYLGKASLAGIAIWTVPVLLFAADGIGSLSYDAGLALLLASAVNLHHFILDGAIWKLRSSRIADILIRSAGSLPGETSPERVWVRRGVWGLATALTAVAAFIFIEREVRVPRALAAERYEDAAAMLDRLAWVGRDDAGVRTKLAIAASYRDDIPEATKHARRLVTLRPSVRSHRELANLLELVGDWEGALGEYQAGLALNSEHPALTRGAGIAYLALNQPDKALPLLERLLLSYPQDEQSLAGVARAREMLGESSVPKNRDTGSADPAE